MEGNLCSSFHEACLRLGLLEDDNQYHLAMQEAAVSNSAASLRSLFAVILTWCKPSNPLVIYGHRDDYKFSEMIGQKPLIVTSVPNLIGHPYITLER